MAGENDWPKHVIELLDIAEVRSLLQRQWIALNRLPPLARHDWLLVEKGTPVGVVDALDEIDGMSRELNCKVRIYVRNGYAFHLGCVPLSALEEKADG